MRIKHGLDASCDASWHDVQLRSDVQLHARAAGFEAVRAEVQIRTAFGLTVDTAFVGFAEFSTLWLKHGSGLLSDGRGRREAPDQRLLQRDGHEPVGRVP